MKSDQELHHEAIEYRIKRSRQGLVWSIGLIVYVVGLVGMAVAPDAHGEWISLLVLFIAVIPLSVAASMSNENIFRRVISRRVDYSDPPLDDWQDYLEQRGAFGGQDVVTEADSE